MNVTKWTILYIYSCTSRTEIKSRLIQIKLCKPCSPYPSLPECFEWMTQWLFLQTHLEECTSSRSSRSVIQTTEPVVRLGFSSTDTYCWEVISWPAEWWGCCTVSRWPQRPGSSSSSPATAEQPGWWAPEWLQCYSDTSCLPSATPPFEWCCTWTHIQIHP